MTSSEPDEISLSPRVVVVAASLEGIDALARLINELPATFPLPIVVHVRGMRNGCMARLVKKSWRSSSMLKVMFAKENKILYAGYVYVVPEEKSLVFSATGVLDKGSSLRDSAIDQLFESAAHWYLTGVIGVVLSGLGTAGTSGLNAIAKSNGIRVVQSPYDADFPDMPTNALIGDDVQHSVMLDQMGALLQGLVAPTESTYTLSSETYLKTPIEVVNPLSSLERSIRSLLNVMRKELEMDIAFITRRTSDRVMISHAMVSSDDFTLEGVSFSAEQSLCQRVLDGRLPAVMPDVAALRTTHDVPDVPMAIGAYIATPVRLKNGALYGTLCCLNFEVLPKLGNFEHDRLQMSARQIAELIDEAGGRL